MVGKMNRYQWRLFFIIVLSTMFGAEALIIDFLAGNPDAWCWVPELNDLDPDTRRALAIPKDSKGAYQKCLMYDANYTGYTANHSVWTNTSNYHDNGTWWTHPNETMDCQAGWEFSHDHYKSTIREEWTLVCDRDWLVALSSTFYMGGVLLGSFFGGQCSDRFGRTTTFWWFMGIRTVGSLICVVSPSYIIFCIGRCVQGTGAMACNLASFVLLMEFISHKWRPILGVLHGAGYVVSLGLLNLWAYLIRYHVFLQVAVYAPSLLVFLLWPWLPESPRWLIVRQRYDKAERILRNMAKTNKKQLPDNFDLRQVDLESHSSGSFKMMLCKIFTYPKLRIRTAILCLHWFTDSLMYYAIYLNVETMKGNTHVVMLLLSVTEVFAGLLTIVGLRWRRCGRCLTCALSLLLAGVSSIITIPLLIYGEDTLVTVFTIITKFFVSMGFAAIYVYTSELFPTEVRNIGIGLTSTCARVSGMMAPFIGPPLSAVWLPLPTVIFATLATVSGALTLFLPETLGQTLPETLEEAENFTGYTKPLRSLRGSERGRTRGSGSAGEMADFAGDDDGLGAWYTDIDDDDTRPVFIKEPHLQFDDDLTHA